VDPVKNPFSPGAGAPPPELVGRDDVLEQSRTLFARVIAGRSEKSIILTGLRGVGKTVLLNEMKAKAEEAGFRVILIEAPEEKSLPDMLAPSLKSLLFGLDRMQGVSEKVKRSLRVLRAWVGTPQVTIHDITYGLAYDPEHGVADSGNLETDLGALFEAVAEAAQDRKVGVALLIDEVQYLSTEELSAIIVAMHRMQQRQLPLVFIGAGLPTIPGLAGAAKSYSERLFSYPTIGALTQAESSEALADPVIPLNVAFTSLALKEIFRQTQGYPYFIQEWGYQCWNVAKESPIDDADVEAATTTVLPRLDESFFRVRFDRLNPSQRRYLRAMAELDQPCKSGDIAALLKVNISSLGPVRAQLINKGMIYSPAHGDMAFTVPLFGEFMIRAMPELN
jgi:hypothetical protein